jgi:glycosyltransferase involved in cell wall biosynthesis
MVSQIVVSVLCPTFNSEKWVEQTLNSFIQQVTSFRYEILVRDDASTDGTVDILKRFEREYPQLIKLLLKPVNTFEMQVPYEELRSMASGSYLAYCDGDDSWQDQRKLQRQYETLQDFPQCIATYHDFLVRTWNSDGKIVGESLKSPPRRINSKALLKGAYLPWCVLFHRQVPIHGVPVNQLKYIRHQDRYFCASLGNFGSARKSTGILPSISNVHVDSEFGGLGEFDKQVRHAISLIYTAEMLKDKGSVAMAESFRDDATATLLLSLDDDGFKTSLKSIVYLVRRLFRRRLRIRLGRFRRSHDNL